MAELVFMELDVSMFCWVINYSLIFQLAILAISIFRSEFFLLAPTFFIKVWMTIQSLQEDFHNMLITGICRMCLYILEVEGVC